MKKILKLLMASAVIVMSIHANNVVKNIPENFYYYKNSIILNTNTYTEDIQSEVFNNIGYMSYFSGMIEHESCITLTNKKCWSARSELLTRWDNGNLRENGVGLGQITRAWNRNGSLRMDTLTDLKKRFPKELKDLNWNNIKDRGDLQIRAIMLLWKDNYNRLPNSIPHFDKVAMADSAYNGGYGFIIKDRKSCGLKANCNPDLWFGNVETINNRGNAILYGNRTANQINRHHVKDVLMDRMPKYYLIDWDSK